MESGTLTLAEIETRHYPVGMEINVEVGNRSKVYRKTTHKVVEDHKHHVVLSNGTYRYCVTKADMFYLPVIRVEEYGDQ